MTRSKILAVAHAVPERVVTNKQLADSLGVSADEIAAMTGVKERRYISEGEGNVTLAKEATEQALQAIGMPAADLEMIVCATSFPDHQFPGNSAFLQEALGIAGNAILDVRCQGAGFLAALWVADQYIRTGTYKRILVVGSDIFSTALDYRPEAKQITAHFGDAAGVVILGPSDDESGLLSVRTRTDARYAMDWYIPLGSIQHPRLVLENLERGEQYQVIHWDVINREAVQRVPEVIAECCAEARVALSDVDKILVPNISATMIRRLHKATGIAEENFVSVKSRFGNTGTAGIPLALSVQQGLRKLKSGGLYLAIAYGSGFSWGAALIRW